MYWFGNDFLKGTEKHFDEPMNNTIFSYLAYLLIIGSLFIFIYYIIKFVYCRIMQGRIFKKGFIVEFHKEVGEQLFAFISLVLLLGAVVHFYTALKYPGVNNIGKEIISAVLMSACAITLVALHRGIELFLEKGIGNRPNCGPYNRHDALLIAFIISGGAFIVITVAIWFICHDS